LCGCHDTHLDIAFKGEFWSRSQPKEVEATLKKSLTLSSINTLQIGNSRKNTKINTKADFELGNGSLGFIDCRRQGKALGRRK
jgi:hypothetical protein